MQQAVAGRDLDAGNVGQQAAEADRDQQKRLELLDDTEVQQPQADAEQFTLGQTIFFEMPLK